MCGRGFHFCQKLEDVFGYYQTPEPFGEELIVYEVEALGEIETEGVKSVTDRLKIVSVVDPQEYAHLVDTHEYDERGNLIKKIFPMVTSSSTNMMIREIRPKRYCRMAAPTHMNMMIAGIRLR
jgi:hypothetical protein